MQSLSAGVDALLWHTTVPDVPVVRLVDPSLAKPLSIYSGIRFTSSEPPAPMAEPIIRKD